MSDPTTTSTIALNVRILRAARGLSARALGELAGLPRNTITNLENGRKDAVSVDEVVCLARAMDIPPLELLAIAGDVSWFTGPDVYTREAVLARVGELLTEMSSE